MRPSVALLLPLFILAASQAVNAQQWTLETGGGAASFEDESATGSGYVWGSWQGGLGPLYGRAGLAGTGFESGASGQATGKSAGSWACSDANTTRKSQSSYAKVDGLGKLGSPLA